MDTIEKLQSVLLTIDETEIIIEALKHWADSAKSESMFTGLMLAALAHKEGDSLEESKDMRDKLEKAGIDIEKERQRKIYPILAKLV